MRKVWSLGWLASLVMPGLVWAQPGTAVAAPEPTEHPLLWVVEGEELEAPQYLYGTIHLPDARVLARPAVVAQALERCEALYTEVPMDPMTQMGAMRHMMLEDGQTLDGLLGEELYARLGAYLETKGLSARGFRRFKVWVVATQLQTLDYAAQMQQTPPLDMALFQEAQQAGKEVGGIETIEEQLAVFDETDVEDQIAMLAETLDQLESAEEGDSPTEGLVQAYLEGDLETLMEASGVTAETDDPDEARFMEALIHRRNALMAERIAARVRAAPGTSHFFAVGAAHYPGGGGILERLEAEGFTVRRLTPADAE